MIYTRAPVGGEVGVDHRFRQGGQFEPFYIPRIFMPQVDQADYPDLLAFADAHGIGWTSLIMPAQLIRPHQRIDHDRARHMAEDELAKPILISYEPFILDGHHRWWEHNHRNSCVSAYSFHLDFDQAIAFLFSFPKTYSYGDGQDHKEQF